MISRSCWRTALGRTARAGKRSIRGLRAEGLKSVAAPLPLTSLTDDVAALERTIERVGGPIVLVGHAYAGGVIAAGALGKVKALVYVAALAPDEGETVADVFYRTEPHPAAPKLGPGCPRAYLAAGGCVFGSFRAARFRGRAGGAFRRSAADCIALHQHEGRPAALEGPAELVPVGRGRSHDRPGDAAIHGRANEGQDPLACGRSYPIGHRPSPCRGHHSWRRSRVAWRRIPDGPA